MLYSNWRRLLSEHFPERDPDEANREWAAHQQRLSPGQSVTDEVFAKAPFGAWVDIGVRFPALLEIALIDGLTPSRYQADDWCPVGSEVNAQIRGFSNLHQVHIGQIEAGEQRRA